MRPLPADFPEETSFFWPGGDHPQAFRDTSNPTTAQVTVRRCDNAHQWIYAAFGLPNVKIVLETNKKNVAFIFSTILLTYWIESVISKKDCISG